MTFTEWLNKPRHLRSRSARAERRANLRARDLGRAEQIAKLASQGLTRKDIAARLGCGLTALKSTLARAKAIRADA